jgi:autophagy-related protein 16-1
MLSEIHLQLLERNARETTPFISVYEANATLVNQVDALQLKCEALERENSSHQLDDAGGKGSTNAAMKNETRLRDKLEKLQEELNDKLRINSEDSANALKTAKELSAMKDLNTAQAATISNLKQESDRKEKIIEHLTTELDEAKNSRRLAEQQYEGLKETIRTLQEENDALEKEHRKLIDRLVSGKEQTSNEINTLNEMVDHLKKEVDMLRTLKVQEDKRRSWFGKSAVVAEGGTVVEEGKEATVPSRKFGEFGTIVPQSIKYTIGAHAGEATSVRYDGTGADLIATAGSDSVVKVWDTNTGTLKATLRGTSGHTITACDISGGLVAGGGSDKMCRIWNIGTERMVHQLIGHSNKITCVRLFGGEKGVITGSADRSLKIWDISRKTYRQTTTLRHGSTSNCVDVASDSFTAVSGHTDGGLQFWDIRNGDRTADIPGLHDGGITSVQFHPSIVTQVLTTGKDSTLKVIDIRTCTALMTMRHDNYRNNYSWSTCALSPDGAYAGAVSSTTGEMFIWRTIDGALEKTLRGHKKGAAGFAWSFGGSSGQQVVSVDQGGTLIVWV